MHIMSPLEIRAHGSDPVRCAAEVAFRPVDFSRPFIHEEFTQLYYTPLYRSLSHAQRLRYNQLFGVRVNEQFMALENDVTNRVVVRLLDHPRIASDPVLADCLGSMVREEERHYRMFRSLNLLCLPEAYERTDRYFTRLGWVESRVFTLVTGLARQLPFLLWFIIALEEYSIALSRALIQRTRTESLGPLEENFVRVHAEHVKDEVRHVHLDVHVIRACLSSASSARRALNAALLRRFMKDLVIPKRSGLAVVRRWIEEHPELEPHRTDLIQAVRALQHDDAFQRSLFNRSLMPRTFALFDAQPELADLGTVLRGYERRG